MRVAVLGTGLMARVRATEALRCDQVSWLGIGSTNVERAVALARQCDAAAGGHIEDVLSSRVDAVIVAGSSAPRAAQIRRLLPLGIPIFCEKPLATDLTDAYRIVEEAADAGVEIQLGFQRRFDADYAGARALIRGGELGTLYSLNLTSRDHRPPPENFVVTSGGIYFDLGVHDYDVARWLTGEEVQDVFAIGVSRSEWPYFGVYDDSDTAITLLRMTSGLPVVVTSSRHSPDGHDVRAEIFGSRHNVSIGSDEHAPLRSPKQVLAGEPLQGAPFENFLARFRDAFDVQTRSFINWAAEGGANPCTARDGLESLRIAAAADLSRREQRTVQLAEV